MGWNCGKMLISTRLKNEPIFSSPRPQTTEENIKTLVLPLRRLKWFFKWRILQLKFLTFFTIKKIFWGPKKYFSKFFENFRFFCSNFFFGFWIFWRKKNFWFLHYFFEIFFKISKNFCGTFFEIFFDFLKFFFSMIFFIFFQNFLARNQKFFFRQKIEKPKKKF